MRDRFIASLLTLLGVSWVLGLIYFGLALVGPLAAGFVFVKYRAGVTRRTVAIGAAHAALAVAVMIVPVVAILWFLITATSDPGEAHNLLEALVDVNGEAERIRGMSLFSVASLALAAVGGALAAWLHTRQLDREYWTTDEQ